MYNIILSNKYLEDLTEIMYYISFKLFNPDAAISLKLKLNKTINGMQKYPFIGSVVRLKKKYIYKYRKVKVGNYYLIYYVDNNNIYVARLVYSRRDINNIIL